MNADFEGILHSWREGVESFNRRDYWQAHEHWEKGWKELPPHEKHSVQALIQACAVFYLMQEGRLDPARRLTRRSLEHFLEADRFSPTALAHRIEITGLRALLEQAKDSSSALPELSRIYALKASLI